MDADVDYQSFAISKGGGSVCGKASIKGKTFSTYPTEYATPDAAFDEVARLALQHFAGLVG